MCVTSLLVISYTEASHEADSGQVVGQTVRLVTFS